MTFQAPQRTSLGNMFGAPAGSADTSTAALMAALPESSSIQWPGKVATTAAMHNPFSTQSKPVSRDAVVKAAKEDMMSAFSGLGLQLDANGNVVATAGSAARELLASKGEEKRAEEAMEADRQAKRRVLEAAKTSAPKPVTALSQAIGAFDTEVERSGMYISKAQRRKGGMSSTMSRRAREKNAKTQERSDAFDVRKSVKNKRDVKRQQRNKHTRGNKAPSGAGGLGPPPAPAAILAKNPPMILKASAGCANAGSGTPQPMPAPNAQPQAAGAATPTHAMHKASNAGAPAAGPGGGGYLHVNTRSAAPVSDPTRTLYDPNAPEQHSRSHSVGGGSAGGVPNASSPSGPVAGSPGIKKMPTPANRPAAPPANVHPPPMSSKLINAQFQFASDLATKFGGCLDMTNFTVVGVLGLEGVGKSTLMSLLASPAAIDAGQVDELRSRKTNAFFTAQSLESVVSGKHETNGVDMAVTCQELAAGCDGLVLLDSPPLFSTSALCDLLNKNESPRFGALTPEQQIELASLQYAIFLISVCHYVVVVHDQPMDTELLRFFLQVEEKMQQCRLPNISGGVKDKHVAKLVYVYNKTPETFAPSWDPTSAQIVASHERLLEQVFCRGLRFYDGDRQQVTDGTTCPAKENRPINAVETKRNSSLLHCIPFQLSSPFGREVFTASVAHLRREITKLPNKPSFSKSASSSHVMTFREWLSNGSRVWEAVRKSSALSAEYTARDHH
ncbi:TPA: hypothetical protein N0F65_001464 [Lagenidium giganteum]|uniref:Protein SMG9 n=1 Tax=Lagenidium giganteum TaxID=4803 RepID=A0AAV2YL83_9STRA|nr:TPA: hypothetical protein N0F65_001464 [Lagenidium giganteum]